MITKKDMKQFLELYLTINNVQDRTELLSNIIDSALDIVHCDAGTLYLLENNSLKFCQMHTRSLNIRQSGFDSPIDLPPVPLEENYVCAWAALHNQIINVKNVNTDKRFDFSGAARYDKMTGYHTVSMLVVPMTDEKGRLIGVMQLINALSDEGKIVSFDKEDELLISAVALQAATSLTNIHYAVQISLLLDSLVKSLSTAVDERSSYTGSHTRHMVQIAEHFLDWLEKTKNGWIFDSDRRKAFLMSVWLHDIGKLTIPLEVMDKATRLGSLLPELEERLRVIGLLERNIMESHAVKTKRILQDVKFPKIYEQVPVWASDHHEFLNGKGYPEHIAAENIPPEARLLTILDVFEALTAKDRPYKKPMPLRKALLVLDNMASCGQIDPDILSLFKKSRAWRGVL